MSGRQIVDRWNRAKGQNMPAETDRDTLAYLRACMELAGTDDGAPIHAVCRRLVARLLEAEGKLRDIRITIDNHEPAR